MTENSSGHLFNITEIPRLVGEPLMLEFYGGDITSIYSDVLLVSTFKDNYLPTPGTIFGRIKEKFSVSFGVEKPDPVTRLAEGLYDFHSPQTDAYKRLWVLEMTDKLEKGRKLVDFQKSIIKLEKLIDAVEYLEIESISIPLLGTGAQGISIEESATSLLGTVNKWASKSLRLSTIRIFAYDINAAAKLNRYIDAFFGIDQDVSSSTSLALLNASRLELKEKYDHFCEIIKPSLAEILRLLDIPEPSVKSIAVAGRSLAELCSGLLIEISDPSIEVDRLTLSERLSYVCDNILKNRKWMWSYFRLLQSTGNLGAHHSNQVLTVIDAVAIVIAVLRISEYTSNVVDV